MGIHHSELRDPWHIDILFTVIQQTLTSLASEYHQKPYTEAFYCKLTLLYDMLDALMVRIPDPDPLFLGTRNRHLHLRAKQVQHHIVQAKRE